VTIILTTNSQEQKKTYTSKRK